MRLSICSFRESFVVQFRPAFATFAEFVFPQRDVDEAIDHPGGGKRQHAGATPDRQPRDQHRSNLDADDLGDLQRTRCRWHQGVSDRSTCHNRQQEQHVVFAEAAAEGAGQRDHQVENRVEEHGDPQHKRAGGESLRGTFLARRPQHRVDDRRGRTRLQ